jgi:hypothetical protein
MRRGFVVMTAVAVLCAAISVALAWGGAMYDAAFLLGLFAFCAFGGAMEAIKRKRHLGSIQELLSSGTKAIYLTRVERVSLLGGISNPRYYLTLEGIGELLYRPVPGLSLISPAVLETGQEIQVHLAGNPALFLQIAPRPASANKSPSQPASTAQIKR